MKNTLIILCFLAFSSVLFAQNPRIETFGDRRIETYTFLKGGDSVQFIIMGKLDTLQTIEYYINGKPSQIRWKKDSTHRFDELGRLNMRTIKSKDGQSDIKIFNEKGNIVFWHIATPSLILNAEFDEHGQPSLSSITTHQPSTSYFRLNDKQGIPIHSERLDTLKEGAKTTIISHDTLFYENGLAYQISLKNAQNLKILESSWYNSKGELVKSLVHDSLRLTSFKDNIDCYYGLKNKKGDVIITPRFDGIKIFEEGLVVATLGETVVLFNADGSPMTPPLPQLSEVGRLSEYNSFILSGRNFNSHRSYLIQPLFKYFYYRQGDKFGVMTDRGALVMPPQSLPVWQEYIGDGQYFRIDEKKIDTFVRKRYLNRQGKDIFSASYKNVSYTGNGDYFYLSFDLNMYKSPIERYDYDFLKKNDASKLFDKAAKSNALGLGKAENEVMLDPKFCYIKHLNNSNLFIASVIKTDEKAKKGVFNDGIFDTHKKRWLLDTTNFVIDFHSSNTFVIKDLSSQKYGIMDTLGKYIVPFIYDSIGVGDARKGLFWVKKGRKYQILEIKNKQINLHKSQYDFLESVSFNLFEKYNAVTYFLAKRMGKWGVIGADDKEIMSFEYDYASKTYAFNGYVLVKNNQAAFYRLESIPNKLSYLPHNMDSNPFVNQDKVTENKIFDYCLVDNSDSVFFINDTGKVLIPPQYNLLKTDFDLGYARVEDANKKQKIIFFDSGKIIDYTFNYTIEALDSKSNIIVVKDELPNKYGVVSTNGKILNPCINYGVAIGDPENSTFFVKRDKPVVPDGDDTLNTRYNIDFDTLNAEDNDWLMYNGEGKLLNTTAFNFPINFKNGLGVGMKGGTDFNLYKSNGSIFNTNTEGSILQTFRNIRRDDATGIYALYFNQGLTPSMILTNRNGQILVKSGIYDGVSKFYGKYALVSASEKIGLIDTLGHEIIAPQDLRIYQGHFMDSIDLSNKLLRQKKYMRYEDNFKLFSQPLDFTHNLKWHPDSLDISVAQRASLWNLLLEKCLPHTVASVNDIAIPRVKLRSNTDFFDFNQPINEEFVDESPKHYFLKNVDEENKSATPRTVVLTDKTIGFALSRNFYSTGDAVHFHNFYQRNNRWEELNINDLLNIQGEKRLLMNDLIIKKVKALKEGEIDCSDTSVFITTVENRFILTKKGVDFYFDEQNYTHKFVIISFTWAELTPFLKMKIY